MLVIVLCVLAAAAVVLYKKAQQPQAKTCLRCNILLLDIDILRADELPCYGYVRNTTPNICALAKKAVLFENNYSPASWTLPSIFSTITSLYPAFHRVRTPYVDKLFADALTLAQMLQQAGYHTILVGGGDNPALMTLENGGTRGYDEVIPYYDQVLPLIKKMTDEASRGGKPWFIHYYLPQLHMPYFLPEGVKPMENLTAPKGFPVYRSDFLPLMNAYLKKHTADVFKKTTINQYRSIIFAPDPPHDSALANLFYDLGNKDPVRYLFDANMPEFIAYMQSFDQNNPVHVAFVRMLYDTILHGIDKNIGMLFKLFNSKSFSDTTITVVMSDHGEAFGEHGTFSHVATYHSELYHTPLIIRSPGLSPQRIQQPSSNMDIFPTLLQLTGIPIPHGLQGRSLIPSILHQQKAPSPFVLSDDQTGLILQTQNWLYILPYGADTIGQSILYDKKTDPLEKTNVATKYPDITRQQFIRASTYRSYDALLQNITPPPDINQIHIDPEKLKRMQKEGYF